MMSRDEAVRFGAKVAHWDKFLFKHTFEEICVIFEEWYPQTEQNEEQNSAYLSEYKLMEDL